MGWVASPDGMKAPAPSDDGPVVADVSGVKKTKKRAAVKPSAPKK